MIDKELTPKDYIAIFRRRWILIGILAIMGGSLGYGITHFLPKRYKSQTLVLVQQPTVPGDYVKPTVNGDTSQRLSSMKQEILSRSRLEPVIQQFGIYRDLTSKLSMEDLVDSLRKAIEITPIAPMAETRAQGLPGFYVSVTFGDPRTAQQVCSAITSMFMEENLKRRQQQAQQTTKFLGTQLGDAKAKLDEQDAKLADFKRHYIGALPDQEQTNLNLLAGLTSQLDATTQSLSRAQQDRTFTESMLSQQIASWQASRNGQNPETAAQQLSALQAQLAALKSKYTDDHPDVVKLKGDIDALKLKLASEEEQKNVATDKPTRTTTEPGQVQALRAQIHQYENTIKEMTARQESIQEQIRLYQGRVQSSPAIEQQYKELTRDYQTALEGYNDLLKKRDQSAIAADLEQSQQGEQFQVLDPANFPDKPSFPNKLFFGLGGLGGGLALGLGLAFFLEVRDTSLRTEQDVETFLHLPVLAMVPDLLSSKGAHESN
jgi:polysaccharide chain length determinant protein (PEP-CTERM system associated)